MNSRNGDYENEGNDRTGDSPPHQGTQERNRMDQPYAGMSKAVEKTILEMDKFKFKGSRPSRAFKYESIDLEHEAMKLRYEKGTVHSEKKTFKFYLRSSADEATDPDAYSSGLDGKELIPYCSLEILANAQENPIQEVFISEGENCVEALNDLGLNATCSPYGSSSWSDKYSEMLLKTNANKFTVFEDNDESGRKYAMMVAGSILKLEPEAEIRIVSFTDFPEGGDVADFLEQGGTLQQLRERIEASQPIPLDEVSTPEPSNHGKFDVEVESNNSKDAPPFHCLEPDLAGFLKDVAISTSTDPSMAFTFCFGVLAGAIGGSRRVEAKPDWSEPSILWTAVVGKSGIGKTPVFKKVGEPLDIYDKELGEAHAEFLDRWKVDRNSPELSDYPIRQQCVVSDATVEALGEVLKTSPSVVANFDELSFWSNNMNAYKKGGDRDFWNSAHVGATVRINRKGSPEPIIIDNPCISILGATTPVNAKKLMNDGGDGMASRFLIAYARNVRFDFTSPGIRSNLKQKYVARVLELCKLGSSGSGVGPIKISPEAIPCISEFFGDDLDPNNWPEIMAGTVSKMKGHVFRIAGCIALYEDPNASEISKDVILRAIEIAKWFLNQAVNLRIELGMITNTTLSSKAGKVLKFIERKGGCLTPSDIVRGRLAGLDSVEKVTEILKEIEDSGQGYFEADEVTSGRPKRRFFTSTSTSKPS